MFFNRFYFTKSMNSPIYSFAFIFAILISLSAASQNYSSIINCVKEFLSDFKNQIEDIELSKTEDHEFLLQMKHKAAPKLTSADPFPCNLEKIKLRSDTVPENVNKIRPGDIDIIAGMGDSLTAGVGISAPDFLKVLKAPKIARSWSAGGEETWRTYRTLPNILKVFNPKLFGFALPSTQNDEEHAQFNVALSGARSNDIPAMAEKLVRKIKQDARVDLKNHWKMVTLMIGDNDFCSDICNLPGHMYNTLEKHREDLIAALRHLRDNLPRTIVNIVPPLKLDGMRETKKCSVCRTIRTVICPCIIGAWLYNETKISDVMAKWQQVDLEVSNLPEFHSEDFTVISHMFTLNYTFPKTQEGEDDYGFLAPDCFHFSERGQARFANDIWNSLLEPYGKKSTDGSPIFSKFNCPSEEHPYIYTKGNSG